MDTCKNSDYTKKRRYWSESTSDQIYVLFARGMGNLSLHCVFSYALWCRFLVMCCILWCLMGSLSGLIAACGLVPFWGCGIVMLRLIPS